MWLGEDSPRNLPLNKGYSIILRGTIYHLENKLWKQRILKYCRLTNIPTFTSISWSNISKNISWRYFKSESSSTVDFLASHTNIGGYETGGSWMLIYSNKNGHAQQFKKKIVENYCNCILLIFKFFLRFAN